MAMTADEKIKAIEKIIGIPLLIGATHLFGIPISQWALILDAIHLDIANAKKVCGGDGLGCKGYRGFTSECRRCPMEATASIREAMSDV